MDALLFAHEDPAQQARAVSLAQLLEDGLGRLDEILPPPEQEGPLSENGMRAAAEVFGELAEGLEERQVETVARLCRGAARLLHAEAPLPASRTYTLGAVADFLGSCLHLVRMQLDGTPVPQSALEAVRENCREVGSRLPEEAAATPAEAAAPAAAGDEPAAVAMRLSVLVADDEEIIRAYLADLLEDAGHYVTAVADGLAAQRQIEEGAFDLIFTDIKMPGADGIQVLKHAKRLSPDTEVIVITGYASVENAAAAVRWGAYDYIMKPFDHARDMAALLNRVGQTIHLRRENRRLLLEVRLRNQELKRYVDSLEDALGMVEEKQQALIHADRMATLGVLAAGVAHEINNPTTFIRGNLQTLQKFWSLLEPLVQSARDRGEGSPQADFAREELPGLIRDMLVGTDRITRIVSGLRTFVHPARHEERRSVTPHECIEEALALTQPQFRNRLRVEKRLMDDPPDLTLSAQQVSQVFVNLFLNAADAMEQTADAVLRVETAVEDDAFVVRVTDNGCGMDEETLDRIFNPFFTTKPVDRGTGLGLSIALGIVRQHGGQLRARSRAGEGTTFTVALPLHEAAATIEAPPRILVADDDAAVRRLLEAHLAERGYEVETADGGFQAVYKIGEMKPDAVLLDVRMPDMDGFEVIRNIRQATDTRGTHILVITALQSDSVRQRLEELAVDGVFRKPLDLERLGERLESLLGERGAAVTQAAADAPAPAAETGNTNC